MAYERASVFQVTQWGIETTPGTPPTALKRPLNAAIMLAPSPPVNMFRPAGYMVATTAIKTKEVGGGAINGVVGYGDILYLLSCCLCRAAISTPGGGTLTRRWTYIPKMNQPNILDSMTVENGDPYMGSRASFVRVNDLTLRFTNVEAAVTGNIVTQKQTEDTTTFLTGNEVRTVPMGGATSGTFALNFRGQATTALAYNAAASVVQAALEALSTVGVGNVYVVKLPNGDYQVTFLGALGLQPILAGDFLLDATTLGLGGAANTATPVVTAGAAPVELLNLPVDPDTVSFFLADSEAGLSAGRLTRATEFQFSVGGRFTPQVTADDSNDTFSALVEKAPTMASTLVLQQNSIGRQMMADLRAKKTKYFQMTALGPIIEGALPYRIEITMCFKLRNPRIGDNNDVHAGTYEMEPVYDPAFKGVGGAISVIVDTTLTAL